LKTFQRSGAKRRRFPAQGADEVAVSHRILLMLLAAIAIALNACAALSPPPPDPGGLTPEPQAASRFTRGANADVLKRLPFEDQTDFELANRGRIASPEPLVIEAEDGTTTWDMGDYAFIAGDAPDTVNPSLWRQARLNGLHGLFEVVDGIYQVRGYDLSNVTFLRGDSGWIVIDPLITVEAARAALALVNRELGERPVRAVIYTHSHVDHFGGVAGVTTPEAVAEGSVRILAPEGFTHHAVSENVLAGNVMSRRAGYMFGRLLEPGAKRRVDSGLGKATSVGRVSMIPPTDVIGTTGTRLEIDGIEMVFQYTPNAEAPAEMMFYLPKWNAFCAAEEANGVLHNLYTLRGAQVRSGKDWARWLEEAIQLFGADLEVVFGSHHWPRWGRESALDYLAKQRDLYRYIHDQTLRLANQGLTPREIAEEIELPDSLGQEWFNRDYYGTLRHNSKATYQYYLGWFDGNPANLDPLPPVESARRYVEWMGGADAVIEKGRAAFAGGDYRWVAEVINHLVFAEPRNDRARWLQADALEQLGYQAESGPWRNFYLTAAFELREGVNQQPSIESASADVVAGMTSEMLFDFMAVRINGPKAGKTSLVLEIAFTDRGERWVLEIENGVLHYREGARHPDPDILLESSRPDFIGLVAGGDGIATLLSEDRLLFEGNPLTLARFGGLFDAFDPNFEIVRP
jgi:alkyl sulfatase BDS1-like metallo-beta-lactamase superfamily hydrolase